MKTVNVQLVKEEDMSKKSPDSKPRNRRKVHFDLPKSSSIDSEGEVNVGTVISPKNAIQLDQRKLSFQSSAKKDERKVHGTGNYVNGTLNFSMNDYMTKRTAKVETTVARKETRSKPILFRNQFTNDASAKSARKNCSIDQQYWDNAVGRRGILLHVSAENQQPNKIKFRTNKIRRYTSMLMKPTSYLKRSRSQLFQRSRSPSITPNKLELPTHVQLNKTPKTDLKSNPFEKFTYKLISIKKPDARMRTPAGGDESHAVDFDERALSIVENAFSQQHKLEQHCTSEHLSEILQMAHRWQSTTQMMPTSDNVSTRESSTSVEFCTLKKLDVKQ